MEAWQHGFSFAIALISANKKKDKNKQIVKKKQISLQSHSTTAK